MTLPQKIDEWIKEAEKRPASAPAILRLIANRLVELTARDEELLAENIALQNGSRVEKYRQRITHLEFQLDLLKRRFGAAALAAAEAAMQPAVSAGNNLLLYHPGGRILRLESSLRTDASSAACLGSFSDELAPGNELPRLLSVPSNEELLLLFTSGRVSTCQLSDFPLLDVEAGGLTLSWDQAALPDEPHGGESLAALMPLMLLPLSDYFVQVSRRGCVKKTMLSLAETILSNHFIGRGTLQKADQPFEIMLCPKNARLALVTFEGRLLVLDVEDLPFSVEERIKLEPHDHVVAAFLIGAEQTLLCLTQTGKLIQRDAASLEPARSANTRGLALISPSRLDQGTRFIGAAALSGQVRLLILNGTAGLTLYNWHDLQGAGALPADVAALAFCTVPSVSPETLV